MGLYIYILGVQFNEDLSSVKYIFKSVQYLNKEYSIYYPVVFFGDYVHKPAADF